MAETYQVPVEQLARFKRTHDHFKKIVNQEVVGYDDVVTDLLIGLLGKGHVLLEGVPGTAKTTTAKSFSNTLGLSFKRLQFTQDLMPQDITGYNMLNPVTKKFELRKGPVFTNFLLADEINRAPPKTQSAMLETMEERQVSIEGTTFPMDSPFIVVATMNPVDSEGVYRLPEAQKDRFMIRTIMHYVAPELEERMIKIKIAGGKLSAADGSDGGRLKIDSIREGMKMREKIYMGDETVRYLQRVAAATRNHPDIRVGASPRSMTQMLNASQAYALISGRPFVLPSDVKYITPKVLGHRLIMKVEAEAKGKTTTEIVKEVLAAIPEPKVLVK
ncbi:MAG: MoxR-like ATPase [Thermoplasmata archaeon]|jgi:MoxR-like ATPase|nr:MoxR-like ATPase [Thermoplasmata archaeon]